LARCDCSFKPYERIVPGGLTDYGIGSSSTIIVDAPRYCPAWDAEPPDYWQGDDGPTRCPL
jgi:hypothetical protein